MSSGKRATLTMAVLYAVYRVYAAVLGPLTTPVIEDVAFSAERADIASSPQAVEVARRHLADAPWAAEAQFKLNRDREGFVFFNEVRRIEDDRQNKVRLRPFALVWFDPRRKDGEPYVVTCGTAVVEFEDKFAPSFSKSDPGRIVGGVFDGEVHVTGPDGLELKGENVWLSEKDGHLYSDYPISFAYGPAAGQHEQVRGRAEQFEITLAIDDDSLLGQDMPRIAGMEKIVLRRNVALDIVFNDDGRTAPVAITSEDQFEYQVEARVATFSIGVEVSRPTHAEGEPEQFDRLKRCDRLSLVFEPKPSPSAEVAAAGPAAGGTVQPVADSVGRRGGERGRGIDLNLQLHTLWAIGREVELTSDENELHGMMDNLHYDVAARTLHMLDDESVKVQIGSAWIECPDIRLVHGSDSRIRSANCVGPGRASHVDGETGEIAVDAQWRERLVLTADGASEWDLLELNGDARVVHRQQKLGAAGDVLRVWFDQGAIDGSGENLWEPGRSGGRFPLRRVVAEQRGDTPVAMVSPQLHLETGRLEAEFVERATPSGDDEAGPGNSLFAPAQEREDKEIPVVVKAGDVRAKILFDPESQRTELGELDASTDVQISRTASESNTTVDAQSLNSPFFVEGESLALTNETAGQILKLQGAPARIRLPEAEIEGNDLRFDRGANEARVIGPGTILVLVDEDFEGRQLQGRERELSVRWREQMRFDGQLARFFGGTEAILADSVMKCDTMEIGLNQRIDFSADRPQIEGLDIATIRCRDGVSLEYHEWERGNRLVGFRKVKVHEFSLDRSTGAFHAQGPGDVQDWQRGEGGQRVRLGPQATTQANQKAEPKRLEWSYTHLTFEGELNGNQRDRYATLEDRVEVMHGPVKNALQTIDRRIFDRQSNPDEVESAENAVWLGSERMHLQLHPGGGPQQDWLKVVAFGNAEMEGKVFRGRADSISYDQSQEQFTMRGKGNEAGLYYQKAPGQPFLQHYAQTIHLVPSRQQLWVDGSSGLQITPP